MHTLSPPNVLQHKWSALTQHHCVPSSAQALFCINICFTYSFMTYFWWLSYFSTRQLKLKYLVQKHIFTTSLELHLTHPSGSPPLLIPFFYFFLLIPSSFFLYLLTSLSSKTRVLVFVGAGSQQDSKYKAIACIDSLVMALGIWRKSQRGCYMTSGWLVSEIRANENPDCISNHRR